MESSMNSSVQNKDNNPTHVTEDDDRDDLSEESGWTAYLEDFPCSDNIASFTSCSPSLVSDAAWYGTECFARIKRLSFKRSKNSNPTKYSRDQDLEDTASSPKVSTLEQMQVNNFLGDQAGPTSFSELVETKENNGENVVGRERIDQKYVDLRKRGLCVVPMSAFVNYFG